MNPIPEWLYLLIVFAGGPPLVGYLLATAMVGTEPFNGVGRLLAVYYGLFVAMPLLTIWMLGQVLWSALVLNSGLFLVVGPLLGCDFLITAHGIRRERRFLAEQGGIFCRRCNYNLTGNRSGVCPECGTLVP
jgi:hypothetical protein